VLGRWVSDLEVGDVLGPVDHVVTPFLVREYAHAVEETAERHVGVDGLVAPPTMVHGDKKRLFDFACPEGAGPDARLHLVYDATYHKMIPAGRELTVSGEVTDSYEHKGRQHVTLEIEVRDKATGELYTSYRDTSLVSFRARERANPKEDKDSSI
jgi:acyl dehydratase